MTKSLALIVLVFFPSLGYAQKVLELADRTYEEQIRTVMVYPSQGTGHDNLLSPAAPIDNQNLVLEFDDLQEERNSYYLRLVHCNFDWKKSDLSDLDFMSQYNEYPINDYTMSSNTSIRYFHYRILIPPVKIPGNYVAVAYREGDENDIILTKRVLVFSNQVSFSPNQTMQGLGTLKATNQQLNFIVNYPKTEVVNPYETIHTVIRQNLRWDNARMDIKPSFIREDRGELDYRFFDQDNHFQAGNEFRFVDFRSLNFPGQNTGRLDRSKRPFELSVQKDKSREFDVYAQYRDLNGQFLIENLDYREASISSDYLFVNFSLTSPSRINGKVYVLGAFNQWLKNDESEMSYKAGQYQAAVLLKQGRYDYQYWVENGENSYVLEGSHFETENLYEILVYYRPFRPNADLLIGYYPIIVNQR